MSLFLFDSTNGERLRSYRILLLGSKESGKTSILNRWAPDRSRKTLGIAFQGRGSTGTINLGENFPPLNVLDLHGAPIVTEFWPHFLTSSNTQALIYVVDGTNFRQPEDRQLFWSLFEPNDLTRIPILLFVNKRDLPQYGNVDEIVDSLNMHNFRNRLWHVQSCSATTGEGIREGLLELYQMIRHHRKA